jgi:hypothetical protein
MRRDIFGIQTHSQMYTSLEHIYRHLGDRDEAGAMLHALCVLLGSEDVDRLVVGAAESFETFIALLAVVKAGSHTMEAEEGRCDELGGGPFARLLRVVAFDVAVDFADAKAYVVPI